MVAAQFTASNIMMLLLALQSVSEAQGGRVMAPDAVEYHPGHAPHYVTRLHRYEHEGVESMLEEEAKWAQEVKQMQDSSQSDRSLEGGSLLEQVDESAPVKHGFVKLGRKQVQQLEEHHESLGYGYGPGLKEHPVDPLQPNAIQQRLTPESAALQLTAGNTTSDKMLAHRQQLHATPLMQLGSQYVGPIGVGTKKQSGCTMPSHGESGNSSAPVVPSSFLAKKVKTCTVLNLINSNVVFDTGSTNIWVPSVMCHSGTCKDPKVHKFNHSESATFHQPSRNTELTVKFGTGKVSGHMAQDDIHIGPFSVHGQTFAMMEVADGIPPGIEGILGLAFPAMSANGVKPLFSSMIEQKSLPHNEFAFYFSPDKRAGNALLWGGVDPAFYEGDLKYFPVVEPYYWSVKLLNMKIGNEEMIRPSDKNEDKNPEEYTGPVALLDTGTTFITADKDHFPAVMEKLAKVECTAVTKESHPDITITLEDVKGKSNDFVLTNKQYMTASHQDPPMCSPAFMQISIPKEHGPGWVLGDVFLRYYFTVFDRGNGNVADAKVALAPSSNTKRTYERLAKLTEGQSFNSAEEDNQNAKPAKRSEQPKEVPIASHHATQVM